MRFTVCSAPHRGQGTPGGTTNRQCVRTQMNNLHCNELAYKQRRPLVLLYPINEWIIDLRPAVSTHYLNSTVQHCECCVITFRIPNDDEQVASRIWTIQITLNKIQHTTFNTQIVYSFGLLFKTLNTFQRTNTVHGL